MKAIASRFVFFSSALAMLACTEAPAQTDAPVGRLEVALLAAGPEPGSFYGLGGTFVLDDPEGLSASVSIFDANEIITLEPRVGTHALELCSNASTNPACEGLSGWELYRHECNDGATPGTDECTGMVSDLVSDARLVTENPQDVNIAAGRVTTATFRFALPGAGEVTFGRGRLSIDFAIDLGFPVGDSCSAAAECASHVCEDDDGDDALTCQAPSCSDGVENGEEEGPDCGGTCDPCPGAFTNSGQQLVLSGYGVMDVQLADLDGDLDLDVHIVDRSDDRIWLNEGGAFMAGAELGADAGFGFSKLGDLDGDGDLDLFKDRDSTGTSVWFNDGDAHFTRALTPIASPPAFDAALGDLDADGDLDALVAEEFGCRVWFNDGSAGFTGSDPVLLSVMILSTHLADLDGDGDLDAFLARYLDGGSVVLVNDGRGTFSESGPLFGVNPAESVSLGDVDGDGDVDAYVVTQSDGEELFLNDGSGAFTLAWSNFSGASPRNADLGDVDGDGDLDLFVTTVGDGDVVYLNDGAANFTLSQRLPAPNGLYVRLGDLDGDDDLDALVLGSETGRVWLGH
jgi:hypothetical protein